MEYWILTDIAGKHGCTDDMMFVEVSRRGPAADGIERFKTAAAAEKRAAAWGKRGCHVKPMRREVVCVAVRAADGAALFEFPSKTAANRFARTARRELGAEVAVEV